MDEKTKDFYTFYSIGFRDAFCYLFSRLDNEPKESVLKDMALKFKENCHAQKYLEQKENKP